MADLVSAFGTTSPRRQLLRNLISYRTLLAGEGYVGGIQFIDGSFVENVETLANRDPGDIDVFSILNVPPKYVADPAAWQVAGFPFWQAEIVDRERNKNRFKLDTYAVLLKEMQSQPKSLIDHLIYWYGLFVASARNSCLEGFRRSRP